MSDELVRVVEQVNAAHGMGLVLGERFERGEQGAFRVRDAGGGEFVLKWQRGERDLGRLLVEMPVLDGLRSRGYPIPRYVAWGVLEAPAGRYTVQERLPGRSTWGLEGQAL